MNSPALNRPHQGRVSRNKKYKPVHAEAAAMRRQRQQDVQATGAIILLSAVKDRMWVFACATKRGPAKWPSQVNQVQFTLLASIGGRMFACRRTPKYIASRSSMLLTASQWIELTPKRQVGIIKADERLLDIQKFNEGYIVETAGGAFVTQRKPAVRTDTAAGSKSLRYYASRDQPADQLVQEIDGSYQWYADVAGTLVSHPPESPTTESGFTFPTAGETLPIGRSVKDSGDSLETVYYGHAFKSLDLFGLRMVVARGPLE